MRLRTSDTVRRSWIDGEGRTWKITQVTWATRQIVVTAHTYVRISTILNLDRCGACARRARRMTMTAD